MKDYKLLIFDLDGTVYAGNESIDGAAEFVEKCKSSGIKTIFATNRSNRTAEEVRDQLVGMGIKCDVEDILTAGLATAEYIGSGHTAFIIGEHGLVDALTNEGIEITENNPEYVVVSIDREFNYNKLSKATTLIFSGAKFVATNTDHRLVIGNRMVPGSGSIVASVQTATDVAPVVIGKPERTMFDIVMKKYNVEPSQVLAVGDNLLTDIGAAKNTGVDSALMLTGYSKREDCEKSQELQPTYIFENYKEFSIAMWG